MSARIPLMAGNWKMNLTHPEAVALVQKLAWILADKKHDFARTEVAVIPPFTDLRSVQTLVDGDRLPIRYGAQDVSMHDSGAYTGEISAGMLAKLGCSYVVVGHSERREHHAEGDDTVNAKARQAAVRRDDPDRLRGRGARRTQGGRAGALHARPGRRLAGRLQAAGDRLAGHRLRAGLGDRHRRGRHARRRAGGLQRRSADASARAPGTRLPTAAGSCTADRSRPPTSPGSWPRPTSTALSSAARACRPTSSAGSAGSTTCPPSDALGDCGPVQTGLRAGSGCPEA